MSSKPLWNWMKMWQEAEDRALINVDSSQEKKSTDDLLRIARERDKRFEEGAILAEREGDTEAVWLCMAARRENQRFINKLQEALKAKQPTG